MNKKLIVKNEFQQTVYCVLSAEKLPESQPFIAVIISTSGTLTRLRLNN